MLIEGLNISTEEETQHHHPWGGPRFIHQARPKLLDALSEVRSCECTTDELTFSPQYHERS